MIMPHIALALRLNLCTKTRMNPQVLKRRGKVEGEGDVGREINSQTLGEEVTIVCWAIGALRKRLRRSGRG